MGNKELKNFHSENRTHVTKEVLKGERLKAQNTASAPFGIKIFGKSIQNQTVQGKNLFDIKKANWSGYGTYKVEDDNLSVQITEGMGNNRWWDKKIPYDKTYTLSYKALSGGARILVRFLDKDGKNISDAHVYKITGGNSKVYNIYYAGVYVNTVDDGSITINYKENTDIAYFLVGFSSAGGTIGDWRIYSEIQLEAGGEKTAYAPFVPDSPSAEYPSEILPLKDVKLYVDDLCFDVPLVGYEGDYLEYDEAKKVLKRVSVTDEAKLDFTKPLSEQNAKADIPKEQILYVADGYDFSGLKTLQGECEIYTDGGAYLEAEVKSVRRA